MNFTDPVEVLIVLGVVVLFAFFLSVALRETRRKHRDDKW